MDTSIFSEKTLAILRAAGWSEERRVDTSAYERWYAATNQVTSDVILEFLSRFGGITGSRPVLFTPSMQSSFCIDPREASYTMPVEELFFYSRKYICAPLCMIGIDEAATLLMTADGRVYTVFDSWVNFVGNSGVEALERMCNSSDYYPRVEQQECPEMSELNYLDVDVDE